MNYLCPICGFSGLTEPPTSFNICPCCGTEFDYDDCTTDHRQLRERWIQKGAPWFATNEEWPAPKDWNPFVQLANAGMVTRVGGSDTSSVTFRHEVPGPRVTPERINMRLTSIVAA
jgi:hypothetical protein